MSRPALKLVFVACALLPFSLYAQTDKASPASGRSFRKQTVKTQAEPGTPQAGGTNVSGVQRAAGFVVTGDRGLVFLDGTSQTTAAAQGPKGDTGPAGPQGLQGEIGPGGPEGAKGDTGEIGPRGAKGDTGAVGPQGLKGDTGAVGAQGINGPQGPQGVKGDKGDTGETGAQGLTGAEGPEGPQGQEGPQGPQGEQGLKGDTGLTGVQGDKGDTGETGATGATGPQGPTGSQGLPGMNGGGFLDAYTTVGVVANPIFAGPSTAVQFIGAPAVVPVASTSQKLVVTATASIGTSEKTGTTGLTLWVAYRRVGTSTIVTVPVSGAASGMKTEVAKDISCPFTLNGLITGLDPGNYEVGMAGVAVDATGATWNFNGNNCVTVISLQPNI